MIVIVRNVLKAGDRYIGDLVEQAPTSARVILEGDPEHPDGVWVPERSIDRVAGIEAQEDGTRVLTFTSGTRMVEGATQLPGTEAGNA